MRTPSRLLQASAIVSALVVAGCAVDDPWRDVAGAPATVPRPAVAAEGAEATPASPPARPAAETSPGPAARVLRGTDEVIAPPKPRRQTFDASKLVSLKFEQAPVREVVHTILGDLLELTYAVHQPLDSVVTLSTASPIAADQALSILETILQSKGMLMVQDSGGVFHIGPPDALRGIVPTLKRIDQAPMPAGFGAVVLPLKFIGAAEMAEVLRPVSPPEAFVRIDTLRNLLLMTGTRSQIDGWLEIVQTFDVDLLKGMSVGVFPLQYATAAEVDAALRAVTAAGANPRMPGRPERAPPPPEDAPLGALRVIPLERLNSLLVVAPRAAYLDEVKQWIQRLDRPTDSGSEPQMFVYPVQNGSAQHLAMVLNGIFGDGPASATPADSGVAPGLRPATGTTRPSASTGGTAGTVGDGGLRGGSAFAGIGGGAPGLLGSSPAAGGTASGARGASAGALTALSLGSGIRIVGDDLKNAVLVYASPADYRKIESALKKLDTPATQVLIEATIVEVTLTDDLQYGLQWFFTDKERHGLTGTGSLNLNAEGAIRAVQPGLSYTLTNTPGQVRAVLNLLAERSLIRVISSPSLMVTDNHAASIMVGDQQPVSTNLTVTDGGTRISSIEYKDTGVMLNVTPSVSSGDIVSMNITQAVTDVGAVDSATGQRAFLQRQVSSRVAVKSGEALVLGGLIRDSSTRGSSGVPGLSRLPLIGPLFGSHGSSGQRTELLVVITPRVVRTAVDARAIGHEMRERMRGLRSLADEKARLLPSAMGAAPAAAAAPAHAAQEP